MDIKLELDFSQTGKLEDLKFSRKTPTPFIPIPGTINDYPKERTIWRHMNNNYTLSWWEQKQEVIKKPWWKFWDKDLIKSYWFRRSFEITPELGEFIINHQDKIQELLCTFFPKIWGLQLENISSSTDNA